MDPSPSVSIVIPTRGEAATLPALFGRLRRALPHAEVWLIDGGRDHTPAIVAEWAARWPGLRYVANAGDRGKGHAIRVGVGRATRPLVAQLDADLQFYPEDLAVLLAPIVRGEADMVLGSRFAPGARRGPRSVPGARFLGNRLVSGYASAWTAHGFTDILAGIKAWRREVTASFAQTADDFCYEAELPIKALRRGWRVVDAPVRTDARAHGVSSVDVVRTGLALARRIPAYRWGAL